MDAIRRASVQQVPASVSASHAGPRGNPEGQYTQADN